MFIENVNTFHGRKVVTVAGTSGSTDAEIRAFALNVTRETENSHFGVNVGRVTSEVAVVTIYTD